NRIRLAPASKIAIATFQLFFRASASAAAIAFLASSRVMYFVVPGIGVSFLLPGCRLNRPYGTAIVWRWKLGKSATWDFSHQDSKRTRAFTRTSGALIRWARMRRQFTFVVHLPNNSS